MTTIVPNQLIITINTSIPGYQKLKYSPSMTIPNSTEKTVIFDPLVKLDKTIVDKIPEDLRKKQFFNKGLFQSLLNYTNKSPAKNLNQAAQQGYIDNNIKVTLETIFPDYSSIYIGGKPYVITDVQWTNGSWNVDTKRKLIEPKLYHVAVKDEIISGEQQLKMLSPSLINGPNYKSDEPKNSSARGVPPIVTQPIISPIIIPQVPPIVKPPVTSTELVVKKPIIPPIVKPPVSSTELVVKPPSVTSTELVVKPPPVTSTELVVKPQSVKEVVVKTPAITEAEIIEQINPVIKPKPQVLEPVIQPINALKTEIRKTSFVRKVFGNAKFYNLINSVFTKSDDKVKNFINNNLRDTTNVAIKPDLPNLSKLAYTENVNGIRIIENSGKGDCFFIAVADGINYYNYHNQNSRIINGIYGTGQNLYTQSHLRKLVYEFTETWKDLDDQLLNVAPTNAENLNEIFSNTLDTIGIVTNEKYLEIANDIYTGNDNFLVDTVTAIPIIVQDYKKPFKPIVKDKLKAYITSSNYWANQLAIFALCLKLNLNIIPISITNTANISIPFANFGDECNTWKKYLFLYYSDAHYELMAFNYKQTKSISNTKVIFERGVMPPICILFVIFGAYYMNLNTPEDKLKFTFMQQIMRVIEQNIYKTDNYTSIFYPTFKSYFQNSRLKENIQEGGDTNNYYYNSNPINYMQPKYLENENNDISKLAYHITIDMELRPGTSITPDEMKNAKCSHKWNTIRKSWAEFTGKPYVITPVYQKTVKNKQSVSKNKTQYRR